MSRGWDVYAMAFNNCRATNKTEWNGIKIVPNYALEADHSLIYGNSDTVIRAYEEVKPDAMLFYNDAHRLFYVADLPKKVLDISAAYIPDEGHGPDKQATQKVFQHVRKTIFTSEYSRSLNPDVDSVVIPHAIDDVFCPADHKHSAKLESRQGFEKKFVVLRVDRHQPRKRWDLTFQAFAKFAKNKDDVHLIAKCNPRDHLMYDSMTGRGIDLEKLATQLGISEKVLFRDYFFKEHVLAKLYQVADVFLTTTACEGFGLGIAEAMSCGLPVICPDNAVLREVAGESGVYSQRSVSDFAEKLEWAYSEWKKGSKILSKIGLAGRQRVVEQYASEKVCDKFEAVFSEMPSETPNVSRMENAVPNKIAIVINCGADKDVAKKAVERYLKISSDVYLTCRDSSFKDLFPDHMVAADEMESALLTTSLLIEGDHDFIMFVKDTMELKCSGDDLLKVIDDRYDDYVFEIFKTYVPGRAVEQDGIITFVEDSSIGEVVGPELENRCLLTRRRKSARTDADRTFYSDIPVFDNVRRKPANGLSVMGNKLIPVSTMKSRSWRKICTYQFPIGRLNPPAYADVIYT
jgi:glycosyltransferase involved in cell wall biosynthesis